MWPARALTSGAALQAQRHALVSITKVLQRAHAHVLSPEVQGGRTVQLAVSVLQHTAHSGVTSQAQWRAWCCRVLRDAASVDDKCTSKVRAATRTALTRLPCKWRSVAARLLLCGCRASHSQGERCRS